MDIIHLRASSLPELLDCPARWEGKYIRGLRMPKSSAAHLGTSIHAGTAAFDQQVLDGSPISADDAAGVAVDTLYHPEEDIDWGDDNPQDVESIVIGLTNLYIKQIVPVQSYVAVEATCDDLVIEDVGLRLTGTTDRITEDQYGNLGIADIKTGKSAVAADGTVKTAGHAAQLAVYELLAGVALGREMSAPAQIIGLQVGKTAKGQRAAVGEVPGARDILIGDEESPGLLQLVSNTLHSGLFWGNPRSYCCSHKYCPVWQLCRWKR